jgi:hypothetical protein
MTSVLGDFDSRLARLEKSLIPLHRKTAKLSILSRSELLVRLHQSCGIVMFKVSGELTILDPDLEQTLNSIEALLGHSDLVERERAVIDGGRVLPFLIFMLACTTSPTEPIEYQTQSIKTVLQLFRSIIIGVASSDSSGDNRARQHFAIHERFN